MKAVDLFYYWYIYIYSRSIVITNAYALNNLLYALDSESFFFFGDTGDRTNSHLAKLGSNIGIKHMASTIITNTLLYHLSLSSSFHTSRLLFAILVIVIII